MTGLADWTSKVGDSWAEEARRTDRSFGVLTDRLIEAAADAPFDRALDVGCGAGEIAVRLAECRPQAGITGLDISPALVAAARERTRGLANVAVEEGDASRWTPGDGARFDRLVSRHGVMFFADPVGAFAHLATLAVPAGRLAFSCFRAREDNEWVRLLASVLPRPPEPGDPAAPGPFAFGDRDRVEGILTQAGWRDVRFASVDYAMIGGESGDGDDAAVEDALSYFLRIGPAARAMAALDAPERDRALERLRAMLAAHCEAGRVTLPSAAWIVTARAPG